MDAKIGTRKHSADQEEIKGHVCQICGADEESGAELRPGVLVRPAISEIIQKDLGSWDERGWICASDLQNFRPANRRERLYLPRRSLPRRDVVPVRRSEDPRQRLVRTEVHTDDQPHDPDRAVLHDPGHVLAQARADRAAPGRCHSHRNPAVHLLRRNVLHLVFFVHEGRGNL